MPRAPNHSEIFTVALVTHGRDTEGQDLPPLKTAPEAPWGMYQERVLVGNLEAANSRKDLKIKGYKFLGVNQRKSVFQLDCC